MKENQLKIIRHDLGGISQAKLTTMTGIPLHKIKDAESGKVKISREIAKIMEEKFSYNFRWVLTGEGPIQKEGALTATPLPTARTRDAPAADIKISEDLTIAARVLESGTPYAIALHLNIRSFGNAVDAKERLAVLESNQRDFEKKVSEEINVLRAEVNRLKATYEVPDGETDHFTNTEKQAM